MSNCFNLGFTVLSSLTEFRIVATCCLTKLGTNRLSGTGHGRNTNHRYAFLHIASHDCVRAHGCFVADVDSAENSYPASYPDFLADLDGFGKVASVAEGRSGSRT